MSLTLPILSRRLHVSRASRPSLLLVCIALGAQAAHAGVILLLKPHATLASNILQALLPAISVVFCVLQSRRSGDQHERQLWAMAAVSFAIWDGGQLVYLWKLVRDGNGNTPLADLLWLLFAFPLLIGRTRASPSRLLDSVSWLDTGQTAILFVVLCVMVSPHPGILRSPVSYNVENLAILFALVLRYSGTSDRQSRIFYRKMVLFAVVYLVFSLLGYWSASCGIPVGTLADLCWSLPFTFISWSVARMRADTTRPAAAATGWRVSLPEHLHGASALGITVMSMAGAAVIARYGESIGLPMMALSFLLFAARTSTREWQLQTTHARLEDSMLHDPLTGLANTTLLRRELAARVEAVSSAPGSGVGVLFLDLDRFKMVNDALGHVFGDLLLVEISRRLQTAAVARAGFVARHGGDEFILLLPQCTEGEAMEFAELLMQRLREPMNLNGRVLHITATIGLAISYPGVTADELLQDAGCAMYKAKSAGKNRALAFAPRMISVARQRLDLEADLRKALQLGEIEVHYQPIYATRTMQLRGFEALARWRHPERGLVPPGEFIPIAEDTGLILELGRQVIRRACFQCQAWVERFHVRVRVAVNVSVHQFADPGLLDSVVAALEDSKLDPSLLRLEITESVLVSSYRQVEDVLMRARKLGIGICLDDFGTGYSSLSYLLRIPFDVVKIDRSFVRYLDRDKRRAEMVRMILALANTLKKRIVAEGVETEGELQQLREMGCDMVQGFLLSKPLTPSAVESLLMSGVLLERSVTPASIPLVAPEWRTPATMKEDLLWDMAHFERGESMLPQ